MANEKPRYTHEHSHPKQFITDVAGIMLDSSYAEAELILNLCLAEVKAEIVDRAREMIAERINGS